VRYDGLDPGQTGAFVAVDDDGLTVLDILYWEDAEFPPKLPLLPDDVVAVEEQYVGRGAHASLRVAEWAGEAIAQVRGAGCTLLRPLATTWRAKVFHRPRLDREAAKAAAIALCVENARNLDPELAHLPDVAEAWCQARYARFWTLHHPSSSTRSPP
jgi:hypothetical protein